MTILVDERERLFDKILRSVGDDGRYQKYLFWGFMTTYSVLLPFSGLTQFFQVSLPNHWCHVPGKPSNMSTEQWKNITIPWDTEKKKEGIFEHSKCSQFTDLPVIFEVNSSATSEITYDLDQYTFESSETRIFADCQNGWEYDDTWYDSTLATEQDWVCDRASISALWLSIGATGNLVGTVVFTLLADKIGRKPTLVVVNLFYIVFSLMRLYVTQSTTLIMLMMFLSGLAFPYLLQITVVLLYEQITPNWRERTVGVSFSAWVAGMCILPFLAWLCRDWKLLGILTTIPYIPMMGIIWYIYETPRWLAVKGHTTRAKDVLSSIAIWNRKEVPSNLENMIQELNYHEMNATQESVLELFRHKNTRNRTFLLTFSFISNTLIYYGLIYTIHYLSGNEFLNFFYLSIVELPGTLLGWKMSAVIGRRWTQVGAFVMATACCLLVIFLPDSAFIFTVILLVTCKGLICVSFIVIYIQEIEIFPTSHRASGVGFTTTITAAFVFGVPYIAYSATFWPKLPFLFMAGLGMMGIVASILIPETMGISLPQTIHEAENAVVNQKFWSYYGWRPKFLRNKS